MDWDGLGLAEWYVTIVRPRATLDRLWLCGRRLSYNVGERAAAIDTVGALVAASRWGIEWRSGFPWSYLDSRISSSSGVIWPPLSTCHLSMGGPLANRVTGFFNPVNRVAPNGMPFFYDTNAGGIRDARTGRVFTGSNVFLVAVVNVTITDFFRPYRLVILAWGNGGDGTYASGVWLRDFYWQAYGKYAAVVRWIDRNGNGLPETDDTFEILATWP